MIWTSAKRVGTLDKLWSSKQLNLFTLYLLQAEWQYSGLSSFATDRLENSQTVNVLKLTHPFRKSYFPQAVLVVETVL